MKQLNLVDIWKTTLIGCFLLLLFSCKSSKEYLNTRETDEKKDKIELTNFDLTKIDKLIKDLSVSKDIKLDFIIYDTSKTIDGKPPILVEGSLTDNSTITDKSVSEEKVTDKSEVVIEDKGQVNIRDKLQVTEKKNNRSWIEQLTRFGFVIVLLVCVGVYVRKRWF